MTGAPRPALLFASTRAIFANRDLLTPAPGENTLVVFQGFYDEDQNPNQGNSRPCIGGKEGGSPLSPTPRPPFGFYKGASCTSLCDINES